ncbi:MAG: plastocyanin/azurin family copper-binding protein [Gemmatimonadota bacterium]
MVGSREWRLFGLSVLLALTAGCVSSTDPDGGGGPDATATVRTTDDFRFVADEVHIAVSGTVTWRSNSGLRHSITPVGHDTWEPVEWDTRGGVMLEVTFITPGIYDYRCEYHWQDGMYGRIIVLE